MGRNGTVMADLFFLLFLAAFLSVGSGGTWEGERLRRPDVGIRTVALDEQTIDVQVGADSFVAMGRTWDALPPLVTSLAATNARTIVLRGSDAASYGTYQTVEQALQQQGLSYVRLADNGETQ
ncbi:MAG: hypothetical protein QGI75_07500 [Phycisphaerales bacterium]|jgi:biopolymer transport protein ExbD|nr:hypothetical protein [Phycisphaerales bacterium]